MKIADSSIRFNSDYSYFRALEEKSQEIKQIEGNNSQDNQNNARALTPQIDNNSSEKSGAEKIRLSLSNIKQNEQENGLFGNISGQNKEKGTFKEISKKLKEKGIYSLRQDHSQKNQKCSLESQGCQELEIPEKEKQKILLIQQIIQELTGKKLNFFQGGEEKIIKTLDSSVLSLRLNEVPSLEELAQGENIQPIATEMVEVIEKSSYLEYEKVSFSAQGIVKTQDGREISLDISVKMQRSFYSESTLSYFEERPIDPLIINFEGNLPALTDEKYLFDLDMDGQEEKISFLRPGSGFLALDRNGDGTINSGSELFGARTNDGFAELAAFDHDKNGWIDEDDPIFSKLQIYTKDDEGNDILYSLSEKGIGAIYLNSVDTLFSFVDLGSGRVHGELAKTGIFLREDGTAGTVNHINIMA